MRRERPKEEKKAFKKMETSLSTVQKVPAAPPGTFLGWNAQGGRASLASIQQTRYHCQDCCLIWSWQLPGFDPGSGGEL